MHLTVGTREGGGGQEGRWRGEVGFCPWVDRWMLKCAAIYYLCSRKMVSLSLQWCNVDIRRVRNLEAFILPIFILHLNLPLQDYKGSSLTVPV